jgi:hypothetical protein
MDKRRFLKTLGSSAGLLVFSARPSLPAPNTNWINDQEKLAQFLGPIVQRVMPTTIDIFVDNDGSEIGGEEVDSPSYPMDLVVENGVIKYEDCV